MSIASREELFEKWVEKVLTDVNNDRTCTAITFTLKKEIQDILATPPGYIKEPDPIDPLLLTARWCIVSLGISVTVLACTHLLAWSLGPLKTLLKI